MAYHPQWDGMAKRFSQNLLQLLTGYVENRMTGSHTCPWLCTHTVPVSIRQRDFTVLFLYGGQLQVPDVSRLLVYDTTTYLEHLHAKQAELCNMVEANMAVAVEQQKAAYDERASSRTFQVEKWFGCHSQPLES